MNPEVVAWTLCIAAIAVGGAYVLSGRRRETPPEPHAAPAPVVRATAATAIDAHVEPPLSGAENVSSAATPEPPATVAAKPAERCLARWLLDYHDINGATTRRSVRVLRVRPVLHQIECWCNLRGEERTFSLHWISRAVDEDTGEIIDLTTWVADYKRQRRAANLLKKGPSQK